MIQDVSQKLYKALTEKLGTAEPITRQAVDSSDLPSPIRAYLMAVLEREAERVADSINNRRDVWIAETVDVRRARTAFAVAASRNVQIPTDRIAEVIRQASDVVVRYLVRPSATLQGTIFDRAEPSLDVDEILERMRMFSAYPYFQEVLRHYFAEKEIEHVDRARLDSVLHRIDRQMTSDFSPEEWGEMLTPLYDTIGMIDDFPGGVPVDVLRTFFRDKELGEILLRLDEYGSEDVLAKPELVALLEAPAPVVEEQAAEEAEATEDDEEEAPPPAVEKPRDEERPADIPPPRPARTPPAKETKPAESSDDAFVPLWKQFQRTPEKPAPTTPPPPSRPADVPQRQQGPGVPIWQRFRQDPASGSKPAGQPAKPSQPRAPQPARPTQSERAEQKRPEVRPSPPPQAAPGPREETSATPELDDLERRVLGDRGARSRRMFIRQLFNGSEADYRSALVRIDQTTSWAEASRVIAKEVFRRFDVNIYDEAAVGFTDMVEARFEEQRKR